MAMAATTPALEARLDDLFTRLVHGVSAYVLEAQPYVEPEDAALLGRLRAVREMDAHHATLIADLIRSLDLVPEAGAFPYWYRDLNYLTVPYLAAVVADAAREDVERLDALLGLWPGDLAMGCSLLERLRRERSELADSLAEEARLARARGAEGYARAAVEAQETREAIRARAKAVGEAAKKKAGAA
ncbi:MAG: hypothetical protein ACC662_09975, partial [Planctomycetota bacterium]